MRRLGSLLGTARLALQPRLTRSRILFLSILACCLVADLVLARHLLPNADSVQSYREMLAVRSGNLLLRHWVLTTDNYVLTDLPPMLAGSAVLGRDPRLIYLVPFAVFASLLVAAIQIVRASARTHEGRLAGAYAVLLLIGIPYGLFYNFFFWSDFHVATTGLCLLAILAVAPALCGHRLPSGRLPLWRLLPFFGLTFAAAFSDPLAVILLAGPVLLLVVLRAWSTGAIRPDEWRLAAAAVTAGVCGLLGVHLLLRSGASFSVRPSASLDFVASASVALRDVGAILGAEQVLFTARARLIRDLPLHLLVAGLRLLTALGVVALCGMALWRLPRAPRPGAAQLLVLGASCMATLAAVSRTFAAAIVPGDDFPGSAIRFGVPIFVFLCIAAAVELADRVNRRNMRLVRATGLCLALVEGLAASDATLRAAGGPAGFRAGPDAALASWLAHHHYTYGVGDYWDTQLVEAETGGLVRADPVLNVGGPLQLWAWLTDTSRFGPLNRPQFVIIRPNGLFRVDLAAATRTYGKPTSITLVANQFYVARYDVRN